MGQSDAARWVIAVILYFFVYLVLTSGVFAMKAWMNTNDNRRIESNNPFASGNPWDTESQCSGSSRIVNWQGVVACPLIEGLSEYQPGCNAIAGCEWHNVTEIFGIDVLPAVCSGSVNMTAYGLSDNMTAKSICSNISTYRYCALFECNWADASAIALESADPLNPVSFMATMWTVLKWSITMKLDLGLGTIGNYLWSFIGFYIPFLILLMGIYYMIPIIH